MSRAVRIRAVFVLLTGLWSLGAGAQIVNRLKVDDATFQRYASGRMQLYNPANLSLADSLYQEGVRQGNFRYRCLALSLEFPVRFSQGEYDRMTEAVQEIKALLVEKKEVRTFYFSTIHEYCQYLVHCGRMPEAMLEARAMLRMAGEERSPLGKMYGYRILGLIQSYRDNAHLAVANLQKAVRYAEEARLQQDLPNLYILIAQECVRMKDFSLAESYCAQAEAFQEFFPSIRVKARMTRAYLYEAEGNTQAFMDCYEDLSNDPLYKVLVDDDARYGLDICYLRSLKLFAQALSKADSLSLAHDRYQVKHGLFAAQGLFDEAYDQLSLLMTEKDSIYIKVQNEDLAILDAEMNNAALREEAQRLVAQNQTTILIGFIVMFAIAFLSILLSQWQLRENLDELKKRNARVLMERRAYRKAMDAKEAENALKIKILQNRKSNPFVHL